MHDICEKEAEFCLNDFRKLIANSGGKCALVSMPNILSLYIINPLWQFMSGIRYDADNDELKLLQKLLTELFKSIDMMGCLFSHFPALQYIAPEASGYKSFIKCHNNIHRFMRMEVDRHKKNFIPSDEPKDLIDAYLQMIYTGNEVHESFTEQQLLAVCLDMFMAGSETTMKTSDFMLLHLVRNISIQKRARKELDSVVGRDRLPTLDDKPK
jgi:cytochrome P450